MQGNGSILKEINQFRVLFATMDILVCAGISQQYQLSTATALADKPIKELANGKATIVAGQGGHFNISQANAFARRTGEGLLQSFCQTDTPVTVLVVARCQSE